VRSKKPSAAKPPDGTVFFIDRSLGVEPIRTELINSGLVVKIHDDHFARDEEDRVWLQIVGARGWVVLTKDQRLRYRPLEIGALRASSARVFVLTAGNLRGSEIAAVFLAALPRIFRLLYSHAGPFIARVTQSGQVTPDWNQGVVYVDAFRSATSRAIVKQPLAKT
jgi:predicted nuclease of predicted toxin-antitoxin system